MKGLFKIFSNSSQDSNKEKREKGENEEKIETKNNKNEIIDKTIPATQEANSEIQDLNQSLEDLKRTAELQKEINKKNLSPEDILKVLKIEPEELASKIEKKEIDFKTTGKKLISEIEGIEKSLDFSPDKENENKQTILRKISNNKHIRAAFIALGMFMEFSPSQGAESGEIMTKDSQGFSKEIKAELKSTSNSENAYQATANDFNKKEEDIKTIDTDSLESEINKKENYVELKMINYFKTDLAQISEENQEKISSDFEEFLEQITNENAENIINSNFEIFGSSDQRSTTRWAGGNEELTSKRLAAVDSILNSSLQKYNFKNLSENLAQKIKAKKFIEKMPNSENGPEKGVRYLADLKNPKTNENYTPQEINEIKTNDPNLYQNLLKSCRKITFSCHLKTESNPQTNNIEKIAVKVLEDYDQVALLFDNSGSMGNSYQYLKESLAKQDLQDTKIDFYTFSNELGHKKTAHNSQDIIENIDKIKYDGNGQEKALDAAYDALKKMPDNKKNILLAMTDEKFQNISFKKLEEMKKLASEKTAEVYFYYADDQKKEIRQISLAELEKKSENDFFENNQNEKGMERISKSLEDKKTIAENIISSNQEKIANNKQDSPDNKYYNKIIIDQTNKIKDLEKDSQELKEAWDSNSLKKFANTDIVTKHLGVFRGLEEGRSANVIANNLGHVVSSPESPNK